MEVCEECKHFESCAIVKEIQKWEKEEELLIENTHASWILSDMFCKKFEARQKP